MEKKRCLVTAHSRKGYQFIFSIGLFKVMIELKILLFYDTHIVITHGLHGYIDKTLHLKHQ